MVATLHAAAPEDDTSICGGGACGRPRRPGFGPRQDPLSGACGTAKEPPARDLDRHQHAAPNGGLAFSAIARHDGGPGEGRTRMGQTFRGTAARSGAAGSALGACLLALGLLFVLHASVAGARQPSGWTRHDSHAASAMVELHLGAGSARWPARCCLKSTCINPAVAGPAILNGRDRIPRDLRSSPASAYPIRPMQSRLAGSGPRVPDASRDGPAGPPVYLATARFRL